VNPAAITRPTGYAASLRGMSHQGERRRPATLERPHGVVLRLSLDSSRTSLLAQVLEDVEGCRALVADMLLLELPGDVVDELSSCDEGLAALAVTVRRHLGLEPFGEDRDAA